MKSEVALSLSLVFAVAACLISLASATGIIPVRQAPDKIPMESCKSMCAQQGWRMYGLNARTSECICIVDGVQR